MENTITFSDELRKDAKGNSSMKTAFNDYFIRNIIVKKDGGFVIGSEAFYTTSRYNTWNRWDYLYGSPYYSPYDYYSYSPYYNSSWYDQDILILKMCVIMPIILLYCHLIKTETCNGIT